ncbi:MAG: FHA domain-containing protein [Betaproteobacteria bacterium]
MKKDLDSFQTVLLAEVAGSAPLHEKLGSAEAQRAVDRCLKRMDRSVDASAGRLVKVHDNELKAVFSSADAAFQAAIDMKLRVADLPPVSGFKLEVRVGFAFGPVSDVAGDMVGDAVQTAACLVAMAEPGQVLTSNHTYAVLSPNLQQATRDLGLASTAGKFPGLRAVEVFAPQITSSAEKILALSGEIESTLGTRLLLRYDGEVIIVDDRRSVIKLGRDADSDIVVKSHRVSRHHATLEKRGNNFVLIDKSTNGSFLTQQGKPELTVKRDECVIHGKGVISFAASAKSPEGDCVEFEQI